MNTYTKHFEFFAFVIGALALCVWALVTIPNAHAITFGNTIYSAISEVPPTITGGDSLAQSIDTGTFGNATTTITIKVRVSTSTLSTTTLNWFEIRGGNPVSLVGAIASAESVTMDGGNETDGYLYTITLGDAWYAANPTHTLNTWEHFRFENTTFGNFQVYGAITTIDPYPNGDAFWYDNETPEGSDNILSDIFFQVTTEQNIFELFGTSTVTIGTASSTVDCSQYDGASFFSSSTIAAIGCYAKEAAVDTLNFLIVPDATGGLTFLNEQFSKFQDVFPFSLFFNFNELATFAVNSYQYGNSTLNFSVFGTEFALISSSTLTAFVGQANKDLIFDLQKYLAWFAMIWLAYVIAIKKRN